MQSSVAAAVSSAAHPAPRPRPARRGQLVPIDSRASESADSRGETEDGLAAARGILFGVAAGASLWMLFALGVRTMWSWLVA